MAIEIHNVIMWNIYSFPLRKIW